MISTTRSVVGLLVTPIRQWKQLDRVMVECTLVTHCPTVTLQLHNFVLFRTCRTSSFCTVVWQLARFQLTRRIARSLGDSWASCCRNHRCCPKHRQTQTTERVTCVAIGRIYATHSMRAKELLELSGNNSWLGCVEQSGRTGSQSGGDGGGG